MKKIVLFLVSILLSGSLWAQTPANRTTTTVIADVLSQLPAKDPKSYNSCMKELIGTGEEGILQLVSLMNVPGKGSNAAVEYALSGITFTVAKGGEEATRTLCANAFVKALGSVSERETKVFLIRQLEMVGRDEAIVPLSAYLSDASLAAPAAQALAAIRSDAAGQALLKALTKSTEVSIERSLVTALGDSRTKGAEKELLKRVGTTDPALKQDLLYALSQVGGVASIELLKPLVAEAGYTMEKTSAGYAYTTLLSRMAQEGNEREQVRNAARELGQNAQKAGQVPMQIAALEIESICDGPQSIPSLLKALEAENAKYRVAALGFLSPMADGAVYQSLVKRMKRAKSVSQIELLDWFGREAENRKKQSVVTQVAEPAVISLVRSKDTLVQQSAIGTLVKINGEKGLMTLVQLLSGKNKKSVAMAAAALAIYSGNIATPVAEEYAKIKSDDGRVAALGLLAKRRSEAQVSLVMKETQSNSLAVRTAAYQALKGVVTLNEFDALCSLLTKAPDSFKGAVQDAIVASIAGQSKEKQVDLVSEKMGQAGENGPLYYRVLTSTSDLRGLKRVVRGYEEGEGKAKDLAFEALLCWKGQEVAAKLLSICQDSQADRYFDRAIAAYISLVSSSKRSGENRLIGLREAMSVAKNDDQRKEILLRVAQTGTLQGLLFAGQYLENKPLQQAAANAIMTIGLANKSYDGAMITTLLERVVEVLDNPDANYQKQAIRKHLASLPKETGFVSMFNGKDLTGWRGLVANPIRRAGMSADTLAIAQANADRKAADCWSVVDGVLMFNGKGDNLCTVKQYGDFEMYVDWKLDPTSREADAGIYLRGAPQVQIWDTARVDVGAQVGSGGLYNNQVYPSKPTQVADNQLGEWNTFYIKMVGDRVTVKLNGVVVVNNIIMENYWDRTQPIFPMEQIELQAHGSRVWYRDLYIKELPRPEPFKLSAQEQKEGYEVVFDGTNMYNFTGNTTDYVIENGDIVMYPTSRHGGNLYTKKEYGNFVWRFEFQLTPGANNGLGIRTPLTGDAAYVGMELQILDDDAPIYKDLQPYQYHGSVYGIIPAIRGAQKPIGEWNYQEVIADGNHIKITLNGKVIVDGDIKEATKEGIPDHKQHPGLFNEKGHIGFLGHGSVVRFRNIRVKEIVSTPSVRKTKSRR